MNRIEIAGLAGLAVYVVYTMRNHADASQTVVTTGTQVRHTPQTMPWQNIPVQFDQQGSQIYGNVGNDPSTITSGSDTSNPSAAILYNDPAGATNDTHPINVQPTTKPAAPPSAGMPIPGWVKGNMKVRALVARWKAFGPTSAAARYLASAPKAGQVGGTVQGTINAYSQGGMFEWADYSNAHASPRDFGWRWSGTTWIAPVGGDPYGTKWDANKQIFV